MGHFTVVFDACVLYPAPLRDLLMQLTLADLFRARWTDQIHQEWISNLLIKRPDLTRVNLEKVRDLMNANARDSLVGGYESLTERITGCPDADDRHVIAAAFHSKANAIVAYNLKDFPANALTPYALEAIHPDDFIRYQIDLNRPKVLTAVRVCRDRLRNPPKTVDEYLNTLESQSLPKTVTELRQYAAIL